MKRYIQLKNRFLSLAILFLLTVITAINVTLILPILPADAAVPDSLAIYDPADLLTDEEEGRLTTALMAAEEKTGALFRIATYCARNRWDDFTGDDYHREVAPIQGKNAILLIITYDTSDSTYYYDMYTYGDAYTRLSQKEVDYILDHKTVYNNLKQGHLAAGAEAFLDLSATGYNGRVGVSMWIIVSVCLAISLGISLCVCLAVVSAYKNKNAPPDYPLDRFAKLKLTVSEDIQTGHHTTAVKIPRSTGGGSGGHSSPHGGGSGHRGGR